MKSYQLSKSDFEFSIFDVSTEFKEYIDYVFISEKNIFFVFKKGYKRTKYSKKFILEYYKHWGFKEIKFLKHLPND